MVKVLLTDRTNGLGQEARAHAEQKLSRLARHFARVADAEVEFSEERKRGAVASVLCRINIHLEGRRTPVLSAHERGTDAASALDLALDKIDRRLVKFKERVTHRKQPVSPIRVPPVADEEARSPEPERIRLKLRPMTISEAVAELDADGQAFHAFLDENSGEIQIVARRADGSVALIEPVIP